MTVKYNIQHKFHVSYFLYTISLCTHTHTLPYQMKCKCKNTNRYWLLFLLCGQLGLLNIVNKKHISYNRVIQLMCHIINPSKFLPSVKISHLLSLCISLVLDQFEKSSGAVETEIILGGLLILIYLKILPVLQMSVKYSSWEDIKVNVNDEGRGLPFKDILSRIWRKKYFTWKTLNA